MARKQKRSPYLTAAQAATIVRYGPERSALLELLRQAEDTARTSVAQARGGAAGTIASIDRARPTVQAVYQDAGLRDPNAAAPPLPAAGATDFASAAQYEAGAAQHRLAGASARALSDLADQRASAAAAVPFGVAQARSELSKSQGEIGRRLVSLAQEEGAFTTSEADSLHNAASQRAVTKRGQDATATNNIRTTNQSERSSLRSAGIDPDTGQPIPGGRLDPKIKKPKVSPEPAASLKLKGQIINNRAQYERRLHGVHTGGPRKGKPWTRAEIAAEARAHGVSDSILTAAADLANFGYLLPQHEADLRNQGVRIPKAWKRAPATKRLSGQPGGGNPT